MKVLINAIKNKQFYDWFFEFKNGHKRNLEKECDIIVKLRSNKHCQWMSDNTIKKLIKNHIKSMYKEQFPNAKKWKLPTTGRRLA